MTGNTWACDEDNNCCTGCGPQEEFYNCVDIAIGSDPVLPPPDWVSFASSDLVSFASTKLA